MNSSRPPAPSPCTCSARTSSIGCGASAFSPADSADKFAGLDVATAATGSPVLKDAVGWLDCRVEERLDAGDRTVYLAEVVQSQVTHFTQPLTLQRLLQLAPPDRLRELKRQRHADADVDAAAVLAWRQARRGRAEGNSHDARRPSPGVQPIRPE